jgi:hypothetical protein
MGSGTRNRDRGLAKAGCDGEVMSVAGKKGGTGGGCGVDRQENSHTRVDCDIDRVT